MSLASQMESVICSVASRLARVSLLVCAGVNTCARTPNHNPITNEGINTDYKLEVFELPSGASPITEYSPGVEYQVRVSLNAGASNMKGILMGAFDGKIIHADYYGAIQKV